MKHLPKTPVRTANLNKLSYTKNLTEMESSHDWKHSVLQRLIVVFLGLLTLGVIAQSCTTNHASCAAYDRVEVKQ